MRFLNALVASLNAAFLVHGHLVGGDPVALALWCGGFVLCALMALAS